MRPDEQVIMREAHRLHDERFSHRIKQLKDRSDERFNRTVVDVPKAYRKTADDPRSNIIDDEGRQITTLIYAEPTPHLTPPVPEAQPATTKVEQVLTAALRELEDRYGPINWQAASAQTHDNLGWIYTAPKKVPYKGQPDSKAQDFAEKNTAYKKDKGICGFLDYEFVNTQTVFYDGSVYDPHCIYIWKEVPASTLRKNYGVYLQDDGTFTKRTEPEGNPTGYEMNTTTAERLITVVEYWDRTDCVIVAEAGGEDWITRNKEVAVLAEWTHNFGRVPYFPRPAFITEQLDEDKKFAGPLDGLYAEMPRYKRLMKMVDAATYMTTFSPLQVLTREDMQPIIDDNGNPLVFLELEPGQARQMAPGQEITIVPQSPEIRNLWQQLAICREELQRFSLSPVAKGVSPGADTANAALSNLHRIQLSTLDPMVEQTARQYRSIFRFWLEQWLDEPVYVLDRKTDQYLQLSKSEIPSMNIDVKVVPDQGQQQLLIEKHAMEMWLSGAITEVEFHELRGKENPEEYVLANAAERLKKQLEPVIMQQIISDLGMLDAVNAMIQANAETGSARNAVPGLMQQAGQLNGQPTGMGQGSPGQPRENGVVRQSAPETNTQPEVPAGY